MRRWSVFVSLCAVALVVVWVAAAAGAWACGSLVAPNGAVRLVRTTTLAAYHDGVEHYVTNFEFKSPEQSFGSIIPLPGAPSKVERGGDWTLQRLEREVQPVPAAADLAASATRAGGVEVIEKVKIDALDVTVLRGGGSAVAAWAKQQGFALTKDAPGVLDSYSRCSPYFLAAKYDASDAAARGIVTGDGTPVHLTIPVDRPWVPLRILATGKPASEVVNADVFLLTDAKPELLAGPGVTTQRSEPARSSLLDDLRSDKGMSWVPSSMWLTYLALHEPAGALEYDLAVGRHGSGSVRASDTGVDVGLEAFASHSGGRDWWPEAVGIALVTIAVSGAIWWRRGPGVRARRRATGPA